MSSDLRPDGYHLGHEVCEDIALDAEMEKAYRETLETHLRQHGCDHDFSEVANDNGTIEGFAPKSEREAVLAFLDSDAAREEAALALGDYYREGEPEPGMPAMHFGGAKAVLAALKEAARG